MGFASVAAWVAWIVVINAVDPVQTGDLGFFLFYFTLAIALIGTLSLLGAFIRAWLHPIEHPSRHTLRSFRQSILLSALMLSVLLMISVDVLRWWSLLLVLVIVALVELAFISFQRKA